MAPNAMNSVTMFPTIRRPTVTGRNSGMSHSTIPAYIRYLIGTHASATSVWMLTARHHRERSHGTARTSQKNSGVKIAHVYQSARRSMTTGVHGTGRPSRMK